MAYSIEEILGFVPLTKAIETVKSGVPRLLPEAFYRRNPAFRVVGDKTRRIEFQGTRKNARVLPYGAPPRQIQHLPLQGRDIRLLHTEEVIAFSHELFLQIREFDSYTVQERFREEASRQVMAATVRQINLETSAVNVMLANGKLWFDVDGNLLATSSGADLEIDYGVPAGNTGQVSGIIDASWATATTDIVKHINAIKQRVRQTTGYALKYAMYGANIMTYLLENDLVKEYLRYQVGPDRAGYFVKSGQIPPGLFDLEWIPMQDTFFDDSTGSTTQIWGGDTLVFTPDPADPMVYGVYEGSYPVPKNFSITADVMQQFNNYEQAYGRYGYGMPEFKPLRLTGVYGDTFLPSLHNPATYIIADVTP